MGKRFLVISPVPEVFSINSSGEQAYEACIETTGPDALVIEMEGEFRSYRLGSFAPKPIAPKPKPPTYAVAWTLRRQAVELETKTGQLMLEVSRGAMSVNEAQRQLMEVSARHRNELRQELGTVVGE